MFPRTNKSFTLLELLVVIAIISLLVVISSTTYMQYKEKARQETIGANLSQVRRVADVIFGIKFSYTDLCTKENGDFVDEDFQEIVEAVKRINYNRLIECVTDGDDYCISTEVQNGKHFCVDSSGSVGFIDSALGCNGGTICP
ncbi:MAG: prepilin-type N-terminal cleavage/methylation domain-containing protein [Candidatus Pacebacteria bacterium]|nr:prepilin-type N-terminal cleavage/methylation domain-containing protein [Candidatus Paceibacterota bacterium]